MVPSSPDSSIVNEASSVSSDPEAALESLESHHWKLVRAADMRALGLSIQHLPPLLLHRSATHRYCFHCLTLALLDANPTGPFCADLSKYPPLWEPEVALAFVCGVANMHSVLFSRYLDTLTKGDFLDWRGQLDRRIHRQINFPHASSKAYKIDNLSDLILFIRNMYTHFAEKNHKEHKALGCRHETDIAASLMTEFDRQFPYLRGVLFDAINSSQEWRTFFHHLIPFNVVPDDMM